MGFLWPEKGSLDAPSIFPQPTLETPRVDPIVVYKNKKMNKVDGFETLKANFSTRPDLLVWTGATLLEIYLLWYLLLILNDKASEAGALIQTAFLPHTTPQGEAVLSVIKKVVDPFGLFN